MSLSFDIVADRGAFRIQAHVETTARVLAIEGVSGAGKTTLLHAIAGLIPVERAVLRVDEQPLVDTASGLSPAPHHRRIGYVFQDVRLFPNMTVGTNIAFGARYASHPVPVDPILDMLGLRALMARWPRNLSGGEARRVAIARALASDPRLLLLDEPFAGLDARRRDALIPFLIRMKQQIGLPIMLVSHDPRDAAALADDSVQMIDGRIGPYSSPSSVTV